MPQLPYSPDLVPADFFLFPKLDWGDKRKIETGAVGDIKKRVSEAFRELKKTLAYVYFISGGYFEGDKIVIAK